jgi:hypothetical protein
MKNLIYRPDLLATQLVPVQVAYPSLHRSPLPEKRIVREKALWIEMARETRYTLNALYILRSFDLLVSRIMRKQKSVLPTWSHKWHIQFPEGGICVYIHLEQDRGTLITVRHISPLIHPMIPMNPINPHHTPYTGPLCQKKDCARKSTLNTLIMNTTMVLDGTRWYPL